MRTHSVETTPHWRRIFRSWLAWFGAFVTAAATAIVVTIAQKSADKVATPDKAANIEAIDMLVETPKEGESRPVSLDLKIHNTGTQRSIIKRAILSIRKFSFLTVCASEGGGLDVSATYGLTLPVHPAPGQKIETPLSQQLGPDGADRFKIDLKLPKSAPMVGGPMTVDAGKLFIYHIGVVLIRDASSDVVNMGDAVAALPNSIPALGQDFFLTQENAQRPNRYDTIVRDPKVLAQIRKCQESNNSILRDFMLINGAKPRWFSDIEPQLAT